MKKKELKTENKRLREQIDLYKKLVELDSRIEELRKAVETVETGRKGEGCYFWPH